MVRSGIFACCKEQFSLVDYVEKIFINETLYVDEAQLEKYLGYQKYFPFTLLPWEAFCFGLHNCVYKENGTLRWPTLVIFIGRGGGKNGYLAFEDFCLLTPANPVRLYHIDIFATSEEQAKTSFDDVWNVLEDNKGKMSTHFTWNKECIKNKKTKSELRFRTSAPKTKDGGRPGKIDFDEYHAYENAKLIDVATTGLGKKEHPRTTIITTNGDVRDGPLDALLTRCLFILKGEKADNGILPFICRLDDKKEYTEEKNWTKANPSYHYFPILQEQIKKEFVDYVEDPVNNASFMTKRMNLPQGSKDVEVTPWENILRTNRPMIALAGLDCIGGIDYAKTTDFVSAGLLFLCDGVYYWHGHTWVCKQSKDLHRIHAPLDTWEQQGLLTYVDDVEIDPDIPAKWMEEQGEQYNITKVCIDTYRWSLLKKALVARGFDDNKKGSNNVRLTRKREQMLIAPTLTRIFNRGLIIWGDNPLMRWYINNACMISMSDGNQCYGKIEEKSRKTDGFMAFVAALIGADDLEDGGEKDEDEIIVW